MLYFRRESKEREEKKQVEISRLVQNQGNRGASKSAPWCQSNFPQGVNLTEIQKAEKEKRAQESALQIQKQQLQEQQQQQLEKSSGIQLNWAKKPIEPRKVKSFAEIQAEEQERLAKLTAEARLAAQLKEKEAPVPVNSGNIWNGQSLTWANASSTSQWSSNSGMLSFFPVISFCDGVGLQLEVSGTKSQQNPLINRPQYLRVIQLVP
jgi:lysyl-tRNA synthetase class I